MGSIYSSISPALQSFIEAQPLFFVATAPDESNGHINLSPKGLDTFRILSPTRVAYLDLTGSGNETAAHLLRNRRIAFMFCAFDGKAQILRLYGHGRAIAPDSAEWPALAARFPALAGARQIIVADLTRVQISCGFGVPIMSLSAHLDDLTRWAGTKAPDGLRQYRDQTN